MALNECGLLVKYTRRRCTETNNIVGPENSETKRDLLEKVLGVVCRSIFLPPRSRVAVVKINSMIMCFIKLATTRYDKRNETVRHDEPTIELQY